MALGAYPGTARATEGINFQIDNEEQKFGVEIVLKALEEPIRQMSMMLYLFWIN